MITWQRTRILLIAGATFLLLSLTGYGVARLFIPDIPGVLIPLVGVAVIVALGYDTSFLGIPMKFARWGILALAVGAAGVALTTGQRSSPRRWSKGVFVVVLTATMLTLALWPLWAFGRPSTGQNTYAAYFVTMSEYWKDHTFRQVPDLDPYQPLDFLVRERLLHRYVTGTPFVNAFIASSLGLDSYETYAILTAVLLALLPATLYWIARTGFGLNREAGALVALLALGNASYLLWSLRGQLPFVAGVLFLPAAVGAGGALLEGRGSLLTAALVLSTLFAVYPPLAPYALVVVVFHGGLRVWQKAVPLNALGLTALKLLGLLILVNPVILLNGLLAGLSGARQVSENWRNIPAYPSLAELLGLLPHFSPGAVPSPLRLVAHGLVPIVFAVVGYGLYRAWRERRWLLLATAVPYVGGALVIVFAMDYAYGYYKHGVVTLFAVLVAFGYGLEALWRRGRGWKQIASPLCAGAFLLLSVFTLKVTYAGAPPLFVRPELASVGAVKTLVKKGAVIFVDGHDVAAQLWTSYFLWRLPLSIPPAFEPWGWWGFSSVFGRGDPYRFYHPHAAYTLARSNGITGRRSEPIWDNGTYTLFSGHPGLSLETGWHDLEYEASAFRWMAAEGTVRLQGDGLETTPMRLRVVLQPLVVPLTLEVYLGHDRIGSFQGRDASRPVVFFTRPFFVDGEALVTLRSVEGCFEPARLRAGADRRCLSARFYELALVGDAG